MNVAELMPGFGTGRDLVDLEREPSTLGPAEVHAEQHLRPVLRVGAARARVHGADRVALVVLAAEQRAQLELVETHREPPHAVADLGVERLVALLARELERVSRGRRSRSAARRTSSTSSRARARSPVTRRARDWSSHRSGALTSSSSSAMRTRAASIARYPWAASTRRRRSARSEVKSRIESLVAGFEGAQRPWQSLYFLPLPQ